MLEYANAVNIIKSTDTDKVKAQLEKNDTSQMFPTAIATNYQWTATEHRSSNPDVYQFIPVSPIKAGQYVLQ